MMIIKNEVFTDYIELAGGKCHRITTQVELSHSQRIPLSTSEIEQDPINIWYISVKSLGRSMKTVRRRKLFFVESDARKYYDDIIQEFVKLHEEKLHAMARDHLKVVSIGAVLKRLGVEMKTEV